MGAINQKDSRYSSRSKVNAAVLAWFFGWLGIHRLYIGRLRTGILLLVMGTIDLVGLFIFGWIPFFVALTIVLGLWSIVDFINIIRGTMTDGDGQPVTLNTRYEVNSTFYTLRPVYDTSEWRKWLVSAAMVAVYLVVIVGLIWLFTALFRA